ncbi:MAG TPA: hypothetical protein VKP67_28730 [Xanthobacteraceae bacterium]|nr:hypothetical protein [Xanthobacteraceae bacterium]
MTLIAQLSVNGAPFLIGDVLLSSETKTGFKVKLPLVGDINQILTDHGLPFEVRFTQKINVFDGRIAVAWSGPRLQAERALRPVAAMPSRGRVTAANVLAELEAIDPEAIDRLQLIGLVLEEVSNTAVSSSLFSVRVPPEHVPHFGNVCAAGSGRATFLHILQNADWRGDPTANEYQVAHGLLGALTNQEFRTGHTIANRWGGGFEALSFSRELRRFDKIGDVLHTFWNVEQGSDESLALYPFFYKTTYWRDALILRSASLDTSEGIKLKTNDITLVPPLLKEIGDYDLTELEPVDFSYRAVCCHVLIEKPFDRDLLLCIDQRHAAQDILFQVDDSEGHLLLSDYLPSIIREQLTHMTEKAVT